jgi:hypothetical protein
MKSQESGNIPIVLSLLCVGVDVPEIDAGWIFSSFSGVMVEVEVDREKVLVRGPRWVSLSSTAAHRHCQSGETSRTRAGTGKATWHKRADDLLLVSFHDMPDISTAYPRTKVKIRKGKAVRIAK